MPELASLLVIIQSDHVHAVQYFPFIVVVFFHFEEKNIKEVTETVLVFEWVGKISHLLKLPACQWLQSFHFFILYL